MCFGGGGGSIQPPPAPPAPPPAPTPVRTTSLRPRSKTVKTREGAQRPRGAGRRCMVIPKRTTGVQYTSSGTGVSI